jgi:hypothetical protein
MAVGALAFLRAAMPLPVGGQVPARGAVGFPGMVEGILAAWDGASVVCLGEDHGSANDSELRIGLIRHPEFPRRARVVVVEFADVAHQYLLDRFIVEGKDMPREELRQVWRTANGADVWEAPIYEAFLRAVRDVNVRLPRGGRVRVIAGDDPTISNRGRFIREQISREILDKGLKGLAIYGARHCERRGMGFPGELEDKYPGQIWSAFSFYDAKEGRRALGLGAEPRLIQITGTERAGLPVGGMFFTGRQRDAATLGDITNAIVYFGDARDGNPPPNP